MVIGAHIAGEDPEKKLLFIALKNAALSHPDKKIILFTNLPVKELPQNCLQVNISPKPKNKLLLYYWYTYKLPGLLVKYNIASFISNAGMLPTTSAVKQYLFIDDAGFLTFSNIIFKNKFKDTLKAAQTVFVPDDFLDNELRHTFKNIILKTEKLDFSLSNNNPAITPNELEATKEKYTDGLDYYLFPVNTSSQIYLLTLLKSFSQLKKWQKTSLKIILLFKNDIDENLLPDFKNYKYKNEVVLLKQTVENEKLLTAAAFSFIFFGDYTCRPDVYNAFYYNVPVIAADTVTNNALFNSAVTYAAVTVEGLAMQLQLIYKNEIYKNQLQQKATAFLTKFNSETASQKLYEVVSN